MPMNIAERAILVDMKINVYGSQKTDRTISNEVATNHEASSDAGRYIKQLISKDTLAPIESAAGQARLKLYKWTSPWMDRGPRILGVDGFQPFMEDIRPIRDEFLKLAENLTDPATWDEMIEQQRPRLREMFNIRDFPTAMEARSLFGFEINFLPVPMADDFRVQLDQYIVDAIKEDLVDTTNKAMTMAVSNVYSRIEKLVSHMATRLRMFEKTQTKVDGKTKTKTTAPFHDSLVENIRELVDILPVLNITGDDKLSKIHMEMQTRLISYDAKDLRDDPIARAAVAESAEDIIKRLTGR